jgi:signal transduction histidine kinase
MSLRVRLWLAFLTAAGLAVLVVGARAGWWAYKAYGIVREINALPADVLRTVHAEYTAISLRVNGDVREMNDALLRYAASDRPSDLKLFQEKSGQFRIWINQQRRFAQQAKLVIVQPVGLTVDVGPLLNEIDQTFDQYLRDAKPVLTTPHPQGAKEALDLVAKVNESSLKLLSLASQAHAQAEALSFFFGASTKWWPAFHSLILASHIVLGSLSIICILLAVWLLIVIYRLAVVPLHTKLRESRAISEKREKLAHFGELAAGLAHEIRNPLTAINARLFTLQRSVPKATPEFEDSMVIRAEINRLDRIVKDFLKMARPGQPNPVPVSAVSLLAEVRDLLAPGLEKHSIELQINSVSDTTFRADPQQLKQVLINLIQNAAESIDHDGSITLSAHHENRRLKGQPADVVIIEVTDTGPGIPATVQQHLFDPFFSTKDGGTGLGLPISAGIVAAHGGTLNFRNPIGRGATFEIILPVSGPASDGNTPHP